MLLVWGSFKLKRSYTVFILKTYIPYYNLLDTLCSDNC